MRAMKERGFPGLKIEILRQAQDRLWGTQLRESLKMWSPRRPADWDSRFPRSQNRDLGHPD